MMRRLIIILSIIACCSFDSKQTDVTKLVGIWQDSPEIASGRSDAYLFFENHKFIFTYNSMICDKRTIDYSGTWELVGSDKLRLNVISRTVLEGGKLVPTGGAGSCASDYDIQGGKIRVIQLKKVESTTIQLSEITIDKQHRDLERITFNNKQNYWRINDDPAK